MSNWKTLMSKVIYKNPWMEVTEDKVIRPDGQKTIYGYYKLLKRFIYVVAIDKDNNTYIIQQHRYPLGLDTWEFPAGQIEVDETPEITARKELLEETGLEAGMIKKLGSVYADTGISSGDGDIFLAKDIKKVTNELDAADGIAEAKKIPLTSVHDMIVNGEIKCPHSISAFYLATEYLKSESNNG